MKDRIKKLRNTLELTQTEFADKLGLARNSIASYESGRRVPNDAIIKLICKEFNVDYFWLTEGANVDMFMKLPSTLMEKLSEQYNLNKKSQMVLKTYLEAPEDEKEAIENFLTTLAENLQKEDKE